MQLRIAMGAALMALWTGAVFADSIAVDGQTHHDVIVAETNALYYVMFPETGKTAGYPKSAVEAGSVVTEADPEKRQALRALFEANRPPLPEPPKEPGPKLLREPATPEADAAETTPRGYGAAAPGSPRAYGAAPAASTGQAPKAPAWRQARVAGPAVPQPLPEYHPSHPASQSASRPPSDPGAVAPPDVPEAAAADPQAVAWTEGPAPADAVEPVAYTAAPAAPVVIEHESFTDEQGVKTLVIKGNRQRDPYREARLAQQYRAALAAEAEARAREEAAMAQAQAAAGQAAYQQWLAEQAYLNEYAAQSFHGGPEVYQDGTGYHLVEPTPYGWYAPEAYDPSVYIGGY